MSESRKFSPQFAWRGWIQGTLLATLAFARARSFAPVQPEWLALVVAAAGYRIWAGAYIGPHSNGSELAGTNLARKGPFAFSRHPLYLANLVAGSGLILFANCLSPAFAALLILLSFFHHDRLARREEAFLIKRWGDAYGAYRTRTPRWLGFWKSSGGADAQPGNALRMSSKDGHATETAEGFRMDFRSRIVNAVIIAMRRQGGNVLKLSVTVALLWALAVRPI